MLERSSMAPQLRSDRTIERCCSAVDGIVPDPSNEAGEALLLAAEFAVRASVAGSAGESPPHVADCRAAYRGFGAKPQATRNSLEALMRADPAER